MDDAIVSFVLVALIGTLGIFIIVRIAKAASHTVDKEQKESGKFVKEVKLGMIPAEVEAALGLPETKVDLAEKVLYKYKNMTVEFHDGKVADVR